MGKNLTHISTKKPYWSTDLWNVCLSLLQIIDGLADLQLYYTTDRIILWKNKKFKHSFYDTSKKVLIKRDICNGVKQGRQCPLFNYVYWL